jgi:hypothetical protein
LLDAEVTVLTAGDLTAAQMSIVAEALTAVMRVLSVDVS